MSEHYHEIAPGITPDIFPIANEVSDAVIELLPITLCKRVDLIELALGTDSRVFEAMADFADAWGVPDRYIDDFTEGYLFGMSVVRAQVAYAGREYTPAEDALIDDFVESWSAGTFSVPTYVSRAIAMLKVDDDALHDALCGYFEKIGSMITHEERFSFFLGFVNVYELQRYRFQVEDIRHALLSTNE